MRTFRIEQLTSWPALAIMSAIILVVLWYVLKPRGRAVMMRPLA